MINCLAPVALGLHLATAHIPQRDFNNINPGIYVRTECNVQLGAYVNSEATLPYRRSPVSFYAMKMFEGERFYAGVGVVTGYAEARVAPMAAVGVKIDKLRISFIPQYSKQSSSAIHFSFEF